ncbi:hypothetical protein SARC_06418 [Sphaeroforma arctica JP610]|uniref:Uncharacterized protein n=1 Tax=Sphaeroforma arctica JP610 TaxID=667725 RepID=A0A0L0FZ47_9EUKA|nr:hypothetical protein SARC_06418 [Sphaeroforma arctica JP610]KNC81243.1 hypothetical protein SARC_06418 [Sphaeroforma arctica JP610]|eukprot:XP_014155145.1 hypothetical protein SARC_06418 [Sphaeroforma arctica JP610]
MYFSGENSICGTGDGETTLFKISKRLNFDVHHEFAALDYIWRNLPVQWWSVKPVGVDTVPVDPDVFAGLLERMDTPETLRDDPADLFDVGIDKIVVDMLCTERLTRIQSAVDNRTYASTANYAAQTLAAFHNLMSNRVTHYDAHSENMVTTPCSVDLMFVYEPLQMAIPTLGVCNKVIDFATCYTPNVDKQFFTSPLIFVNSNYLTYRYDALTDLRTSMIQLANDMSEILGPDSPAEPPMFTGHVFKAKELLAEITALNHRFWNTYYLDRHTGRIETGLAGKEEYVEMLLKDDNLDTAFMMHELVYLAQSHVQNREYKDWVALYNTKTRVEIVGLVNQLAVHLLPLVDVCEDELSQSYFCRILVKYMSDAVRLHETAAEEGSDTKGIARARFGSRVMLEFGMYRNMEDIPAMDFEKLYDMLVAFVGVVDFLLAREIVKNERIYDGVYADLDAKVVYGEYAAVICRHLLMPPTTPYTKFCFSSEPQRVVAIPSNCGTLIKQLDAARTTPIEYYAILQKNRALMVPIKMSAEHAMSLFP